MADGGDIIVHTEVQKSGLLMKLPFGHESTKWSRRFFVLKDGFLLYYAEKSAKAFAQTGVFDIHPKGVIPLGGCFVEACSEKGQPFALKITHRDFADGAIFLGAESGDSRDDWIKWITESSRVTYRSAQVGETMRRCLEAKGSELQRQKEETMQRLQEEESALQAEKLARSSVESHAAQLLKEKQQALDEASRLRQEQEQAARLLQETNTSIGDIEGKKAALEARTAELEAQLSAFAAQTELTAQQLETQQAQAEQLANEKLELASATAELTKSLEAMELRARELEQSKNTAQARLDEAEQSTTRILSEMNQMSEFAGELESQLHRTTAEREKAIRDAEHALREKLKAERKLKLAEDALVRLDKALRESGVKIDIEIEADVKALKSFFEDALETAAYEANKIQIMREAVSARPGFESTARSMEEPPAPTAPSGAAPPRPAAAPVAAAPTDAPTDAPPMRPRPVPKARPLSTISSDTRPVPAPRRSVYDS
eukprot:m.3313 g.3313  ORF g.3313 m.3313 type:complete len:489 (-) comp2294_c0_seq1:171-1637(-)